jgi:hypothetical protein
LHKRVRAKAIVAAALAVFGVAAVAIDEVLKGVAMTRSGSLV